MRRISQIVLATTTVLATALVSSPAAPASDADFEMVSESFSVKTKHGKIYVAVHRPVEGGEDVKAPAILTYTPYSPIYSNRPERDAAEWVEKGYARVFADVLGTGNSGGCWDYGGNAEKETGYEVVEWIAKQPWSNGKVAMRGGSYEGSAATAVATLKPPHLTTIIPEGAIVRWYDYAYSGGIRYLHNNEYLSHQGATAVDDEGFDTPLAFDFGLSMPPPLDAASPDWAERVQSRIDPCERVEHTEHGYDDTPTYDKFWLERDYLKDAKKIKIPVLVAHNWGDWNVKQEEAILLYKGLKNSRNAKLFMGSRWDDHGKPTGHYAKTVEAWMDHYLMGEKNGIDKMPDVTSQMADYDGVGKWYAGRWPKTTNVTLVAQEQPVFKEGQYAWGLLPKKPGPCGGLSGCTPATFPSTNINTESHAAHHGRNNHDWKWFETPLLTRDLRLFGSPKVQIWSKVQREWVTWTPSIIDVDPSVHESLPLGQHYTTDPKALVAVTRGWLDSRYRKGLGKEVPVTPGKAFGMTVVTKPQDYTFKKGHYIVVNFQTEINEWSLPKPYPCNSQECIDVEIEWEEGKTKLIMPFVGKVDPHTAFAGTHH